ncbi:hypothetical protein [Tropicimonas sp. IMCC34011]|nr:hypothetical protein [Tropicimonas sp. IMCC34011]
MTLLSEETGRGAIADIPARAAPGIVRIGIVRPLILLKGAPCPA